MYYSDVLVFQVQTFVQFVENMLQVHQKFTEVIQSVFKGDKQFVGALDKACAASINHKKNPKTSCKSPEWVCFTLELAKSNQYTKEINGNENIITEVVEKNSGIKNAIFCCLSRFMCNHTT